MDAAAASLSNGRPDDAPPVLDRPARAPDVELIGTLSASGFEKSQFLARRSGQYVQLTELLFRTLEGVDGERTVADIADFLTRTTDWAVTPDQVAYLLTEKLVPLGLIASPSLMRPGTPGTTGGAAEPSVERSFLMVQAPRRLLGPAAIEAVARFAQHLFAPPVVALLLVVTAAAHAWLFFGHGIENGFLEVLYSPGLLVAVLGAIVVAGLVHEFGHASGLRYGGGRAKSIGLGLYLVYPAFFTDVSESYALSRAARLRTDLGGIYFHLLFSLLLIGLYQVTGWEFLLFTVLLIDFEAVRQVLPLGRLDGYWILADLTGIPDPLSQIAPFLRGAVQSRARLEGARLPTLRPWAGRVFLAYIALTLPAVVLFLVFLVARLPVLLGLVWDALRLQASLLATAAAQSAVLPVVLSVLQIALVGLELAATAFIVLKLGAMFIRGVVQLGRGGGNRRAAALALSLGAVAGLTFFWGPHVSGLTAGAGAGVQYFDSASRSHVSGPVSYPVTPPVGGDHAAVWQNCGFYASTVPPEQAVHSLEHGAVWITYRPNPSDEDLARLRGLARAESHILVSMLPDNPAPVVATAWGRQLKVDRVDDPRLEQFIRAFRLGSAAPERGGPCDGGSGEPELGP